MDDDSAQKGNAVGCGDAMAALAIVRALLRRLEKNGAFSSDDLSSVAADALKQITDSKRVSDGAQEAKRLVQKLNQQK